MSHPIAEGAEDFPLRSKSGGADLIFQWDEQLADAWFMKMIERNIGQIAFELRYYGEGA